jgi:hypothetical protein
MNAEVSVNASFGQGGPACNELGFLEDSYFSDLRFKRQSAMAMVANIMMQVGEAISLVLSVPFVLVFALFVGLMRGTMPLVVLWCNLWRMLLRPFLGLISDVVWAFTHNYTHRVVLKKVDGASPFEVTAPTAALLVNAVTSKPPREAYEQV